MPLQVFGIVRRGHPAPRGGTGAGGIDVRLVESGGLAAAVTDIADPGQLTEDDAARHLDVLILLLRDGPVLPVAFSTVSPDEDAVRAELLDAAADDLTRRLEAVDGLVETRLEIFWDEPAALREVMAVDPGLRQMAEQSKGSAGGLDSRIALGEAVSRSLTDWRQQQADALLQRLVGEVQDVVELESSDPLQQRWAFLLRADALGRLDEAVGALRSDLQRAASVEYVGPLPVYSFLDQVQAEPPQQERSRSAWGF
jgi:hypothetical protein